MGRVAAARGDDGGRGRQPLARPFFTEGQAANAAGHWVEAALRRTVDGGLSGTAWLGLGQLFFSHTKTIASGHWLGTETGRVNSFNAKSAALLIRV